MKREVSKVNIYACKKATKTSIRYINSTNKTETGATPKAPPFPSPLWAMNINEIKLNMIMCPAEILAKSRIISANGLVKIPTISIGIIIGISAKGTPGGLKI
jgi:hypothetical protein